MTDLVLRSVPCSLTLLFLLGALLAGCTAPAVLQAGGTDTPEPSPAQASPTATRGPALALPPCGGAQPPWITDLEVRKPAPMAEPLPRVPFRDPVFGTCVVRVTDRHADLAPGDSSLGLKNEYSRVQSFNADGSRILVRSIVAEWYLYETRSLQPLGRLPLGTDPRWDAEDPDLIYYIDETRLMAYDVSDGNASLVHDFVPDLPARPVAAVWTRYEGRPSADSRYWGLMAEDQEWLPFAFLVYDRLTGEVMVRDMRGVPGIEEDVDHVTISPLGTYFLASFDRFCEPGQLGDDAHPCGLMVYDRGLVRGRGLLRAIGHYDTALDAMGREVVVFQDLDTDHISLLDLESGRVTPLWAVDFSHTPIGLHFSGLATNKPGWAVVSTYSGGYPDAFTWMDDQVFVVELRAGGRVVRLAHTHARVDPDQEHDYWAEPHASTNPDLTRIVFTSNWGRSGTEEVEMYLIELPAGWDGG